MYLPQHPCCPRPASDSRVSRIDNDVTGGSRCSAWLICGFDLVFGLSYIARPIL
jgi:hypothetical protein